MVVNFLRACNENLSISTARNACVGDLVCLCVMENKVCVEQWILEGATALKKVCGMEGRR
jgi:hypothetical protein